MMNKRQVWALALIAVLVVVLVMNRGSVNVDLIVTDISALKSLAFLGFTGVGVAIGMLLK
ncbi:MAG: hypothetical protein EOM20_05060 [Spartobacteria bacterium]|nr:hypothetical protein [Spartobacteria bacterium]